MFTRLYLVVRCISHRCVLFSLYLPVFQIQQIIPTPARNTPIPESPGTGNEDNSSSFIFRRAISSPILCTLCITTNQFVLKEALDAACSVLPIKVLVRLFTE